MGTIKWCSHQSIGSPLDLMSFSWLKFPIRGRKTRKHSPIIEPVMFVFIEKCQNVAWSETWCCRWFGNYESRSGERREHNVTFQHDLWAVIRWAGKLFCEKLFVKYQQIDARVMLPCSKVAFYIFRNIEFHPDNLDLIVIVPVVRFKGKT